MELRKDYLLDRWVVLATERKKRRKEFKKKEVEKKGKTCFFCPGNEATTPPEIGRVEENGKWIIRWFPNKFPAVRQEGDPIIKTHNEFFTFSDAYGNHEVIAECPEHDKQLWDLSKEHIKKILYVYKDRINDLTKDDNTKYVVIFKNHGGAAGTSLIHSHTQVASINLIPPIVSEEISASKILDDCLYCNIINVEKDSDRRCFENNSFVAFAPYASRFNYEVWIFPKMHVTNMNDLNDDEFGDLADILKKVLVKLKELDAAYNFFLHYAPEGENLHLHIEVTPRLATWAGFEFSSDIIINSVAPEDAAKFYRNEE